jgi:SAM-dependent methyltransferase
MKTKSTTAARASTKRVLKYVKCQYCRRAPGDNDGCDKCRALRPNAKNVYVMSRNEELQSTESAIGNQLHIAHNGRNALNRRIMLDSIVAVAQELSGDVFVDIGCGEGGYAEPLRQYWRYFIGLEPCDTSGSFQAPDVFREDSAAYLQYDPDLGLPIQPCCVDVAWMIGSYDHIPDAGRRNAVEQAYKILKPGGRLVICMLNGGSWLRKILMATGQKGKIPVDPGHHCVHSPKTLAQEVTSWEHGFDLDGVLANQFFLPNVGRLWDRFPLNSLAAATAVNAALRCLLLNGHVGQGMIVRFKKSAR